MGEQQICKRSKANVLFPCFPLLTKMPALPHRAPKILDSLGPMITYVTRITVGRNRLLD